MYKTLTNQNDEIYVTDMNEMLTLDVLTKTDLDLALENYLPLTAGSSKKLTGTLYANDNGIVVGTDSSTANNTKGIVFGENGLTKIGASSSLGLYAERNIYLRPGTETDANAGVQMTRTNFSPTTSGSMSLGTSTNEFNNIYGTTIYQNGKQVANKEDLPNINMSDYLPKSGGTLTGTLYSNASTPLFIGYNGKVGMRAIVEGQSGHKGQINISNAWYDSQHYGAQMSAKNDETGKYNAIRVSHNGPQYEDENEVMHNIALTSDIPKFEYDETTKTLNIITE